MITLSFQWTNQMWEGSFDAALRGCINIVTFEQSFRNQYVSSGLIAGDDYLVIPMNQSNVGEWWSAIEAVTDEEIIRMYKSIVSKFPLLTYFVGNKTSSYYHDDAYVSSLRYLSALPKGYCSMRNNSICTT